MLSNIKNKQGGFIEFVIFVVVVILIMKYAHITVGDIINWLKVQLQGIF
jgi:hypothetical protein